jgi:hypothetical protein
MDFTVGEETDHMTNAQRRRDAALRRLRLANRGGVAASVAGAVVVMGLAHQATPLSKAHVTAQIITRTVAKSDSLTRPVTLHRTDVKHKIRPAAAPTAVTSSQQSTPAATTSQPSTTAAAPTAQSAPSSASAAPTAQSAPSSAYVAPTVIQAPAPAAPVTSGVS